MVNRSMERLAKGFFAKKKRPVKYDIRLFDNRTYKVFLITRIPATWITSVAKYLMAKSKVNEAENLREFEVDERLHPKIVKKLKSQIKDIEIQVRADMPQFAIHTVKVDQFKYTKDGQEYRLDIILTGHYGI